MFNCGTGLTARRRKEELEKLNAQLRKINMSLRQNARFGIVYAPGKQLYIHSSFDDGL